MEVCQTVTELHGISKRRSQFKLCIWLVSPVLCKSQYWRHLCAQFQANNGSRPFSLVSIIYEFQSKSSNIMQLQMSPLHLVLFIFIWECKHAMYTVLTKKVCIIIGVRKLIVKAGQGRFCIPFLVELWYCFYLF